MASSVGDEFSVWLRVLRTIPAYADVSGATATRHRPAASRSTSPCITATDTATTAADGDAMNTTRIWTLGAVVAIVAIFGAPPGSASSRSWPPRPPRTRRRSRR